MPGQQGQSGNKWKSPQLGHEGHCTSTGLPVGVQSLVANKGLAVICQQIGHDGVKPTWPQFDAVAVAPEWAVRARAFDDGRARGYGHGSTSSRFGLARGDELSPLAWLYGVRLDSALFHGT